MEQLKPLLKQYKQFAPRWEHMGVGWVRNFIKRLTSSLILDTLTTRFLLLFLMLLCIPLVTTIVFTVSLLVAHMDKEANNQVFFSQSIFAAAIDEANDRLSGFSFTTSSRGAHPWLKPLFMRTDRQLSLKAARQSDAKSPTTVWSPPMAVDDAFLNRIYRRYPNLQTQVWVLSEEDHSQESPRTPIWLAKGPQGQYAISASELLQGIRHAGFLPFGQLVTIEINRVPYRLIQDPIYSGQHEKIARVLHVMPLVQNQILLGHYYMGIYIITVASLILSVLVAMLAGRTITQPLLRLIREVDKLSRESVMKASDSVRVSGVYEIRQMGEAFDRMVKRLRQEHILKDEFVATLTHDLKVPLLAERQTLAYFLKQTYGPLSEEQNEVLDILQASNASCLSLVNGLLEVYRYDSGAVSLLWERFNLWMLLEETVGQLSVLAQEKHIQLTLSAEPVLLGESGQEAAFVYADRMEIRRVLHNLVSNAIINTAPHGFIECRLIDWMRLGKDSVSKMSDFATSTLKVPLKTENRLAVSIRDSGVGFPKEDLPGLFTRFGASRGRNPMSIGLGLYNCYQVIQAHGGMLWVDTTEGEGSAVSFLLPCNAATAQDRRIRYERRKATRH